MSEPDRRQELCPACLAFPQDRDERVIVSRPDGSTVETWHKKDCPHYGKPPNFDDEPTA